MLIMLVTEPSSDGSPQRQARTDRLADLAPFLSICTLFIQVAFVNVDHHQNMKLFLSIAAILAWLFGAMLLLMPDKFYAPTGIAMTPLIATLAQAHGATLIGLGVVDWLGRKADKTGLHAILTGNLIVQLLSLVVVLRTMALGAGAAVSPGVVIHIVLGGLFALFLWKSRQPVRDATESAK